MPESRRRPCGRSPRRQGMPSSWCFAHRSGRYDRGFPKLINCYLFLELFKMFKKSLMASAVLMLLALPGMSRAEITFQTTSPGAVKTTVNVGDFERIDADSVYGLNLNANQDL